MQPQFADVIHTLEQRPDLMKGTTGAPPYPYEDKLQVVVSAGFMCMNDGPAVTTSGIFLGDDSVMAPFDPHTSEEIALGKAF